MSIHRIATLAFAFTLLLSSLAMPARADREREREHDRDRGEMGQRREFRGGEVRREVPPPRGPSGYVLDDRYRHGRYYPPHGHVVEVLPPGHRVVPFRGATYYFHGSVWYRASGPRFVVVAPPIGIFIPVLPAFYTTIWVGGSPYYYADNVYYRAENDGYVVAEAPPESQITEQPATPSQIFAYPKNGQSEQQQANDRYQCHQYATNQTGFDPTQPGGNVPESQLITRRADYQRATKACLEGRGYSVQ